MGLLKALFSGKGPSGAFGKLLKAQDTQEIAAAVAELDQSQLLEGISQTPAKGLPADQLANFFKLGQACLLASHNTDAGEGFEGLPQGADAEMCWNAIQPRLLAIAEENTDVGAAKQGARDVAAVLIELDRHQEAVQLLLAARPGVAPDHEYLLLLSLANLVNSGRDPQAPEMLDQQIDGMQSGQLPVPPELEEQVQAIIRKVRGEDEVEVEPPKVIEAAMPSESPCDRCGNNDWRLPSMVVPTEVQIRPDLKLVCPQCGRVGVMKPPEGG